MPNKTDIAYFIADFLVTENGKNIKILELGEFSKSNFEFKNKSEPESPEMYQKILRNAEKIGNITYECTKARHIVNVRGNREFDDYILEKEDKSIINRSLVNIIKIMGYDDDFISERIQELKYAYSSDEVKEENRAVLGGVSDMLFLCARNKYILNTLLRMDGLEKFQPLTWHYDYQSKTPFTIPEGIDYFVIKPTNASLGDGLLVVSKERLPFILTALKEKNLDGLSELEKQKIKYHFDAKNNIKSTLVQELVTGTFVSVESKKHHATGRVVFAAKRMDLDINVEIIDIYWKLAPCASTTNIIPDNTTIVSSVSETPFNSQPSLTEEEYEKLEPPLIAILDEIVLATYNNDLYKYLFILKAKGEDDKIRFYLSNYSHVLINNLKPDLISMLMKVDTALTKGFLIEQAKIYALSHHLEHPQKTLRNWVDENLSLLSEADLKDLKSFLESQLKALFELHEEGLFVTDKSKNYKKFAELLIVKIDKVIESRALISNNQSIPTAKEEKNGICQQQRKYLSPFWSRVVHDPQTKSRSKTFNVAWPTV